jgi:hypothetical protein
MGKSNKRKLSKQQRLEIAKAKVEKTLKATGYYLSKSKHGDVNPNKFPDLTVTKSRHPSLGDGFDRTTGKKSLPEGAKHFPIGNSHKQGPMLITGADRMEDMGGKKT